MNFIKYIAVLATLMLALLFSCQKDDLELSIPEVNVSGQWKVSAYINNAPVSSPFQVEISNRGYYSSDSITIKETSSDFWSFQTKAAINMSKGTFGTKLSQCELSDPSIGIKIMNGKVIASDSIYFEIQFEDDETPFGITYQIKGSRAED